MFHCKNHQLQNKRVMLLVLVNWTMKIIELKTILTQKGKENHLKVVRLHLIMQLPKLDLECRN